MPVITEPGRCSHEECTAAYKTHKWGQLRATKEGWFFSRDGLAYCPGHLPEWVGPWRERKKASAETYVSKHLDELMNRYAAEDGLTPRQWRSKVIFGALCRRYALERDQESRVAP